MKNVLFIVCLFKTIQSFAQNQNKNWYFGDGTDGIVFNLQNIPIKVYNKYSGIGFEGIAVASDPCSGELLFYTDGIRVIDKNHNLMSNGTGLLAHYSGSQCVQICKVPGTCNQYYIISNSSWDNTPGSFFYSIVDFASNPLGVVTIKNQLINGNNYHQAMRIVPKLNSNNYWLIGHLYGTATYHVFEISMFGITGPVVYNFNNSGYGWTMQYNQATQRLVNMGSGNLKVTLFDFNPSTGVLSNEQQLYSGASGAYVGNFSPDGTKIYAGIGSNVLNLWQYDLTNNTWTNMNSCCWAHDVKTGPDGKTYFIHTFSSPFPLAQIQNANLTAAGNACGYATITNPGNFNGEVRRFPEFLEVPDPPVANTDTLSVSSLSNIVISPLTNDTDPQGDSLYLSSIISGPQSGTSTINGNQIIYSIAGSNCTEDVYDTITYSIIDNTCLCDTALIIIHIPKQNMSLVTISPGQDTTLCTGESILLSATTTGNVTQQWFRDGILLSGQTNLYLSIDTSGSYFVIATDPSGCTDTANQSINFRSAPVANFTADSTCNLSINFTNQSVFGNQFEWSFGDGTLSTLFSPSHTFSVTGKYLVKLIAENQDGCTDSIEKFVNIIQYAPADFTYNYDTCSGLLSLSPINLTAASYNWDFGDTNSSESMFTTHTYYTPGSYTVKLTTNKDYPCFDRSEVQLLITLDANDYLYIPNSFTPNGDGINDYFNIFASETCNLYELNVYNRWGELIYNTSDISRFWDGNYKGQLVQEGVYCYLLKKNDIYKQGFVYVFR